MLSFCGTQERGGVKAGEYISPSKSNRHRAKMKMNAKIHIWKRKAVRQGEQVNSMWKQPVTNT